jgi:NAD(P)-dependent dehydrogenase (short-subunit alcohol dehydrogenase family)
MTNQRGTEPMRFDGRVAIVTGGGRGMGRCHALLLAERGAAVVVNDLGGSRSGDGSSHEPAREVVAEIEAAGGRAIADFSDISSYSAVASMVARTVEELGRLDIVISNAGISDPRVPILEMTPERFDKLVKVHQYGSFNIARCAWPHLVESGAGRIVLTTSNAIFGVPEDVHYAAAKLAVVGMAKSLAVDGKPHGIMVNVVAPGGFTRLIDELVEEGEFKERVRALSPPEKVSWTYAWLAHESCGVTGEVFGAVGGRTTRIFLGQTRGYTASGPDDLRAHGDEVLDVAGYWIPEGTRDDSAHWLTVLADAGVHSGP